MRALLIALLATGCVDFDRPEIVDDMRVLAVVNEPAEIMVSALLIAAPEQAAQFLPTVDLTTTVYAFDPRANDVDAVVRVCIPADEGGGGGGPPGPAGGGDGPPGGAVGGNGGDATVSAECPLGDHALSGTPDEGDPIGRVPGLSTTYALAPFDVVNLLGGVQGVQQSLTPTSRYPRVEVDAKATNDGAVERESAFKRLPFTLDLRDPTLPPDIIGAIAGLVGASPCPPEGPPDDEPAEGVASCLVARGPNKNPPLLGFYRLEKLEEVEERLLPDDEEPPLPLEASIDVDPGESVHVEPAFRDGALEPFQAFMLDVLTAEQSIENRIEYFSKRWFATAGDLGQGGGGGPGGGPPGGGGDEESIGGPLDTPIGVTWTLPQERNRGDADVLVLVVNDGRGGVAVGRITAHYR